ncbi:hypothetical protein PVAP13_4KG206900 [Panicum virgatum]|uniref:Uncharacterized protein n=1 Tax=Panicum virgatum TaxID=38727 RepID=A0A8T0TNG8_PANVG|nr:hypothetical protein PVAP13_4KG206900 [Panicum virgatum]
MGGKQWWLAKPVAALFDWVAWRQWGLKISKTPAIPLREQIRREVSGRGQASPWPAPGAGAPPKLLFTAPHLELSLPGFLYSRAHMATGRTGWLGRTPLSTGFNAGGDTTPAPAPAPGCALHHRSGTEPGGDCAAV